MRRLATSFLAAALLVGLVAQPATARRPFGTGNIPHFTFVFFSGADFGQSEVVQVPTGEWVRLGGGWSTMTLEQLDHFLATVVVEIERDGAAQEVAPVVIPDPEFPFAFFPMTVEPGPADTPEVWTSTWTFTEDHFDGFEVTPAGTVMEWSRTVVWTPRGTFPSDAYPCPNGGHPCVDF
jgi:hypothetical protein